MGLDSGCVVELERLVQQHRKGVGSAVQNYSDVISFEDLWFVDSGLKALLGYSPLGNDFDNLIGWPLFMGPGHSESDFP
jgi:hypothetical protein